MDGKGRYLDNIFVERFWRSLKYEEVYLKACDDISQARRSIAEWINFYNHERPHQALSYNTPWEIYGKVPRFAPERGASDTVAIATNVAIANVSVLTGSEQNEEEIKALDLQSPYVVPINQQVVMQE